jgi:hypothetical protein
MDDESKELLRQLVDAQRAQTEMLRKHVLPLWTRIRFSLLMIFIVMTVMALGVGFTSRRIRSINATGQTAKTATRATVWMNVAPERPVVIDDEVPLRTYRITSGSTVIDPRNE